MTRNLDILALFLYFIKAWRLLDIYFTYEVTGTGKYKYLDHKLWPL